MIKIKNILSWHFYKIAPGVKEGVGIYFDCAMRSL